MEFIEFEKQVYRWSMYKKVTNEQFTCGIDPEKIGTFSRATSKTNLKKINSRTTAELFIDCNQEVPDWFYESVKTSIKKVRICPEYPRNEIPKIARIFSLKHHDGLLTIMLEPGEDSLIDFDFGYMYQNLKLTCTGNARIKIKNAQFLNNVMIEGNIIVGLDRCLGVNIIHGISGLPSVRFMNGYEYLRHVVGRFRSLYGMNLASIITEDMSYIPINAPDSVGFIPTIRENQTHLEEIPEYKSLLGYKKINVVASPDHPIDLSAFNIPELDLLDISGEIGSEALVLPKIGKVKHMIIDCCLIKNTYFGYVGYVDKITVKNPYKPYSPDNTYEKSNSYNTMLGLIKDVFANIIHFCDIVCKDYGNTEPENSIITKGGILIQDKYIEYLGGEEQRDIKSAAKV